MAHAGDLIEPTPGERRVVVTTTAESNGELLATEAHYVPAGRPGSEHYRPSPRGAVHGVGGAVTGRVAGVERTIGPGDQLTIPRRGQARLLESRRRRGGAPVGGSASAQNRADV